MEANNHLVRGTPTHRTNWIGKREPWFWGVDEAKYITATLWSNHLSIASTLWAVHIWKGGPDLTRELHTSLVDATSMFLHHSGESKKPIPVSKSMFYNWNTVHLNSNGSLEYPSTTPSPMASERMTCATMIRKGKILLNSSEHVTNANSHRCMHQNLQTTFAAKSIPQLLQNICQLIWHSNIST